MTRRRARRGFACACGLALALASEAHAAGKPPARPVAPAAKPTPTTQTPTPTKEPESTDPAVVNAREHFQRAQQLYDDGHFEASLLELQRAYDVKPSWRLLFNLGELRFTVHDYVGSLRAFQRFLAEGGKDIEPSKRAAAESKLGTLRSLVGNLKVRVNVDGAQITLDDELLGKSPLPVTMVSAGRHKLTATQDGYRPASTVVAVLGSEESAADLTLVSDAPVARTTEVEPPSKWTAWSWAGLGTSVALAGGSVAMFAVAGGASSDLSKITYVGPAPSPEYKSKASEVTRDRAIGLGLAGASALALGATLYFTLTRTPPIPRRGEGSVRVGVGPRGAFLEGSFQ